MTKAGWVIVLLAIAGLVSMWIGWGRVIIYGAVSQ